MFFFLLLPNDTFSLRTQVRTLHNQKITPICAGRSCYTPTFAPPNLNLWRSLISGENKCQIWLEGSQSKHWKVRVIKRNQKAFHMNDSSDCHCFWSDFVWPKTLNSIEIRTSQEKSWSMKHWAFESRISKRPKQNKIQKRETSERENKRLLEKIELPVNGIRFGRHFVSGNVYGRINKRCRSR